MIKILLSLAKSDLLYQVNRLINSKIFICNYIKVRQKKIWYFKLIASSIAKFMHITLLRPVERDLLYQINGLINSKVFTYNYT